MNIKSMAVMLINLIFCNRIGIVAYLGVTFDIYSALKMAVLYQIPAKYDSIIYLMCHYHP